MIHYGAAADARAALVALAGANPDVDWLARHAEPEGATDPAVDAAALVERFRRRFGAAPTWPEERGR
jgi:hypothetical protein